MAVQLTDDVHWLNESLDIGGEYMHVSAYLVEADGQFVLVDTGSFNDRESIQSQISEITGGAGLDVVVVSHADLPHSGNVPWFLERYEDLEVIVSTTLPDVVGLPASSTIVDFGESRDVCGRTFTFGSPPLLDLFNTIWAYDHPSGVLFTADGFGNYHDLADRDRTSAELPDGVSAESIYAYLNDSIRWLRYADPEKLHAGLDSFLSNYEIEYIAPIHGNPIHRSDLDTYLDRFEDAVRRITDEFDPENVVTRDERVEQR
jgi:flavorubredoxin